MKEFNFKKLAEDIKNHIGYDGSAVSFASATGLNVGTVKNLIKGDRDYKQSTVLKAVTGLGKTLNDYVE